MKSYVVIGLGRFGTELATRLYALGNDVMAIDVDENLVNAVADHVSSAVIADATKRDSLKGLGVQDCDCAVVALGSDLKASVLVTMNVKALGVPKIICKASDDTHSEILTKLGADRVIIPERDAADKLAVAITSPNIMEFIEISPTHGIVECTVPEAWAGKDIRTLDIRSRYGVTVIAIKKGEDITVSPMPDYVFEKDTTLVLLGKYESINKIEKD